MQDVIQMQMDVKVQLLYLDVIVVIINQEIHVLHVLPELKYVPQQHQSKNVVLVKDISVLPLVLHVELILLHATVQVPMLNVQMDII